VTDAQSTEQKLVIEFDGVKREITIPFRICGGAEDLRQLQRALSAVLDRDQPLYYGWVDVTRLPPESKPNTSPISWRADGSYG
jgi:hypothetical protein